MKENNPRLNLLALILIAGIIWFVPRNARNEPENSPQAHKDTTTLNLKK